MEKPITRKETYLSAIASGDKGDLPSPITREEMLLYEIASRGGGGGTGKDGKSAYEQAVEGGYTGTEAEFNASFKDISMSKTEMLNILRGGDNA